MKEDSGSESYKNLQAQYERFVEFIVTSRQNGASLLDKGYLDLIYQRDFDRKLENIRSLEEKLKKVPPPENHLKKILEVTLMLFEFTEEMHYIIGTSKSLETPNESARLN